ncbi:FG-GAP-like repeat-containing protein [Embleya sp. NBC_00888]|uniref:FG-GAP-like repeat-containing protein n=1 Tax=Embleya sp. NBC_00888 TaxID=2975960 RepID=UPI00386D70CA|nr:FG-GAP-like repeat-containing protein [Embleya sp. NBC_00888]
MSSSTQPCPTWSSPPDSVPAPRVAVSRTRPLPVTLAHLLLALILGIAGATTLSPNAVAATHGSATVPPVRVITYNVCGGYIAGCRSTLDTASWANSAKAAIFGLAPDVVMLQELCRGQLEALDTAGYRMVWLETRREDYGCGKWIGSSAPAPSGIGMLVKGSVARTFDHVFPAADPSRADDPTADHYALLCAEANPAGRAALVCATHLDGLLPDQGAPVVADRIKTWGAGSPLILGGDFNADPQDPNMGRFYSAQSGNGDLVEADESDREHFAPNCASVTRCRSGEYTAGKHAIPPAGGKTTATRKFDYIFGSATYFDPAVGDVVDVLRDGTSLSDHLMYVGEFTWNDDVIPPAAPLVTFDEQRLATPNDRLDRVGHTAGDFTGDGIDDLVLRSPSGTVDIRPGDGHGEFADPVQLVSADQGWWDAASITAGDFDGDGRADLLVRWTAGSVFLYPGNGHGGIGGSVPLLPAGSWGDAVDVTAEDFTGDGKADVVVRWKSGRVTLHPTMTNPGSSVPAFGAPIELRPAGASGWGDATDVTAGDFDNDGRADLLVRWRAGSVYLYPGNGQGELGGSRALRPADAWTDVREVTAGDFTGDGTDDVMLRWKDQRVDLLAGITGSGFAAPVTITPPGTVGWIDAVDLTVGDLTDDGVDDVVLRWNSGNVVLYPGDGRGGLGGSSPLVSSPDGAWRDAASITAGDFDGDGRADLLVRWTAGSVFLYPGNGHGGIGGSVPLLPAGSWGDAVDVTAEDFTGDGKADVVVRWKSGRVTLHPTMTNPGSSVPAFGAPIELRPAGASGWGDATDVTAGDFDNDGRADLLVRWRAGSVYLYPGNGQGELGDSVIWQAAGAWTDVVDIVPGRFTTGGTTDIVLRWSDGSVVRQPSSSSPVGPTGGPVTLRATDNRYRVAYFEYTVDVPPSTGSSKRLDARHNSAGFRPTASTAGTHTLYVLAVDIAGNRSPITTRVFSTPATSSR